MRSFVLAVVLLASASAHAQDAADAQACQAMAQEAESLSASRDYRGAAQRYVSIAREHAECGGRDIILWNAALNYESARLMGRAIQVRQALVSNFTNSPLAGRTMYLIGANYHALAIYSQAADYYTAFAERYPDEGHDCTDVQRANGTCADPRVALENALFFRVGLSQYDEAQAIADLFVERYGNTDPAAAASVVFAVGFEGTPEDTIALATEFLDTHGAHAALDQNARAWLAIAHAHLALANVDEARDALAHVIALVSPEALSALPVDGDAALLHVARARDALSEARYLMAEQTRDAARITTMPPFTSAHGDRAIRSWWSRTFARWRDHELRAIAPALAATARERETGMPGWDIASYALDGDMRAVILSAAASVELPEWADTDALADAFDEAQAAAVADVTASVRESYTHCAELAASTRAFSDRSTHCEDALAELDPAHHSALHELRPEREWIAEGLATPGVPPTPEPGPAAAESPTDD